MLFFSSASLSSKRSFFSLSVHECSFIKCCLWSVCALNTTPHSNGHNNGVTVEVSVLRVASFMVSVQNCSFISTCSSNDELVAKGATLSVRPQIGELCSTSISNAVNKDVIFLQLSGDRDLPLLNEFSNEEFGCT